MAYGRNAQQLLGAAEVQQLIGAWKTIIGSGVADPFRDILGADPRVIGRSRGWGRERERMIEARRMERGPAFPGDGYQPHHHRHHHHHHRRQQLEQQEQQLQTELAADQQQLAMMGEVAGGFFPPRNELVDRPGPTRADRVILPMSSGVNILPNTSAQITSRPQDVAFRPERVIIGSAGTSGGAADWIVNDIKVGNKSQFSQSGDVPGDMFAATTIDSFVSFATVQTAMDFVMLVTYVGTNESGAPFYCSVLGTAAV